MLLWLLSVAWLDALLVRGSVAQEFNNETDKAALLAFKGNATYLSWSEDADPCAPACWNKLNLCFFKVLCDAEYGRVVVIALKRYSYRDNYFLHGGRLAHNIAALAPLTELRRLNVEKLGKGVYGDIAWLSGLTELRLIELVDSRVHGNVSKLSSLPNLGRDDYGDGRGGLTVPSSVFGPMPDHPETLLNPYNATLGFPYRRHNEGREGGLEYTSCSSMTFLSTCAERGLATASHASFLSGADECTCCVGSTQYVVEATQRCSNSALEWDPDWVDNSNCSTTRKCDNCCDSCDACEACATCAVCNGVGVATAHALFALGNYQFGTLNQCEHMSVDTSDSLASGQNDQEQPEEQPGEQPEAPESDVPTKASGVIVDRGSFTCAVMFVQVLSVTLWPPVVRA